MSVCDCVVGPVCRMQWVVNSFASTSAFGGERAEMAFVRWEEMGMGADLAALLLLSLMTWLCVSMRRWIERRKNEGY
jgi:hypothetical protein